ncbi:MAG: 2-amino-4-hydroxy-6-hydroxymethyldihydropteridine diphosphokinase [Puniceicoccales bacterium]|jgi:2-amino-4-hydroxy-6-hydroxymethyldihydropteridine diphosphokinase|nr:2-amino-4-hydroxy-6-hydroxymethyldihydropteridine diphosphokinase [Puniceicoccales bacterium]
MKNNAYISLGSNLEDRLKFLQTAMAKLECENLEIAKISSIYETDPQDLTNQPKFLNCVLMLKTEFDAFQLLAICQKIEAVIGKNKHIPRGPRNIDIDILAFNSEQISTPILTLPHPRMHRRNFVLTPLREIAPQFEIYGQGIDIFLQRCTNQSVRPWKSGE